MNQAEAILMALQIWGIVGGLVAIWFLSIGIDQIDEDAQGAYVFRPLLVPGVVMIWPLVLWRWQVLRSGRDVWQKRYAPRRTAHHAVAVCLAVGIVVVLATGLALRQSWPADFEPEQLAQPADADQ
ncbi:MAG: hypothetical protein AAGA12_03535 [Pseudomonadota bacterium]